MRRLLGLVAYQVHDDLVHNRKRQLGDRAIMLGLLDRGLAGFVGPGSGLRRSKKNKRRRRVRECTLSMNGVRQAGRTMVVRAVFPKCLPFPEIKRHPALGVNYHRK